MRTLLKLGFVAVLGLPMAALAGTGAGSVLDVPLSSGLVGAWTGKTLGIATSFVPFLFMVALAVEAFGKPPSEPKDFGAVVWRCLVVVILLFSYGAVFGGLCELLHGVSRSIATQDLWEKFTRSAEAFLADKKLYQEQQVGAEMKSGNVGSAAAEQMAGSLDGLGGALMDVAVALVLLAGQAAFRIVGTFGQVLSLLLYVLGPLAIVASVPRGSDAGTKWLRVFVSVLLWPLISALLVGLLSEYALDALKPHSSYEAAYKSIGLAGVLCVTAFAVPVIASALTGAGMGAVSSGWSSMGSWAGAASGGIGAAAAAAGLQSGRGGVAPPMPPVGMGPQARSGGGGGGGLQSAGVVGGVGGGVGGAGGSASPGWARGGVRSIAPAQAGVSPAADAAAARDIASGGGVEFPVAQQAPVQPPPFINDKPWSEGGISPAAAEDAVPTMKPVALPGPAAAPVAPLRQHSHGAGVRPASARTEVANGKPVGAVGQPARRAPAGARGDAAPLQYAGEVAKQGDAAPLQSAGEVAKQRDVAAAERPTQQHLPPFPKKR